MNNSKNPIQTILYYAKLTHQLLSMNINIKVDHYTGGKLFIHGPKHRKNQVASLKHSLQLFIL